MKLYHFQENGWNWSLKYLNEIRKIHKDKYPTFSLICGTEGEKRHKIKRVDKIIRDGGRGKWQGKEG
jgi:hypothetical protein